MKYNKVWEIYFSPTGTTKTVVHTIGDCLGTTSIHDFTLPKGRETVPTLDERSLVIFGMPTYAGRLPNLMLKYLDTLEGSGALALAIVTFGNRNFDHSLAELRALLDSHGFHTIGAAAFSCEHSFSYSLGKGRPDEKDLKAARNFAEMMKVLIHTRSYDQLMFHKVQITGKADGQYYKPRDRKGVFIDIRKVKPKTNENCVNCGFCAEICPMGAIDRQDFSLVNGICIKCGACFKKCPEDAKYFDDKGYLYHKEELELMYGSNRCENSFFI